MGGGSIRLARLFGIRIGASPSWFVVLLVIIYFLTGYFADTLGGSDRQALGIALLAAILFFVSIVLHELGHARVAQRNGITISGIDLWFFGGVAKLDRDTTTPGEEFRISAAGPAVTAAIVVAAGALAAALSSPQEVLDSARFLPVESTSPLLALVSWLATINFYLLAFNLVPAFPLDGGRIARAIAWRLTGDKHQATRIAGRMGLIFAFVLFGLGAYLALTTDPVNGVWFMVLGFFIGQGARGAVLSSRFLESIEGVAAADLMDPRPVTVPGGSGLADAQEELERRGWPWSAVVDADGRFLGILDANTDGGAGTVAEAVPAGDRLEFAVGDRTPLEDLLRSESLRRLGALVVVDDGARLVGVVTLEQVHRAVAAAAPER